jgi:hypothetical protein
LPGVAFRTMLMLLITTWIYPVRKSTFVMFFALRLITLIAFAMHAMLGCCLLHGSCIGDQKTEAIAPCCQHPAHAYCISNKNNNTQNDGANDDRSERDEVASVKIDDAECVADESNSDRQSNHCDHVRCTFGSNFEPGSSVTRVNSGESVWICGFDEVQVHRYCCQSLADMSRNPFRQVIANRANFQVWII